MANDAVDRCVPAGGVAPGASFVFDRDEPNDRQECVQADAHPARLVALTGRGTAEDRRKSREAGFDAHLTKPVDLDALWAPIASRA